MTNCEDCFMCSIIAQIDIHNDISKLLEKVEQWDKIDSKNNLNQYKQINKFECLVCFFKTSIFNDWKCHIMSLSHMANCHKIEDLYSYVCDKKTCKLLLYGPKNTLIKHNLDKHSFNDSVFNMSILMAQVMKQYLAFNLEPLYFCSHCKTFKKTPIHTDIKLSSKAIRFPIEYYCRFCRIHFLSSHEMIDYHFLSVEHMTIKCFEELCSETKIHLKQNTSEESKVLKNSHKKKKKKNAAIKNVNISNIQTTKLNTLQIDPVSQIYDDIKSDEYTQNVQLNKSLTDPGIDKTASLDNVQTVKKSLVNNDFLEKLNDDVQKSCNKSYENIHLSNHSKIRQQYTNYFEHKINLLKKLKQHEDLIMRTLSYYCDVCDFIAVEKYLWDKHNQLKHSIDSNRSITYCSTCSMFVGGNYQEHNLTIEHSIFLNFLQVLKPVEVLKDNTSLIKLVESGSSDVNSINLEQKEKIELNSSNCFKEFKYSKDNNSKNYNFSLMKEPSINKDDPMIMENGLLLFDKSESKYELEQDEKNTSNAKKLMTHSEITTSNNLLNTLMTNPYQSNVLVNKMPENINIVNALTDDLSFENKKIGRLDEDQLYGEYVIQRLKNIKDTTIKQCIKLEIDYIFYTKMKQ
ncbi:uncharacterized protein MAL13P1.304-like [Melanaphis sacchari]|uniref:uncharacterized protein MAL13P1.304-like n=1 Tax=Melanaphis sacchari TaxID=742174 RepID=UPI000DC14F6A|nr:uncharacterized protein MAL13P1.304-like [Melanaphis sacchari]XP_025193697.1 uncharacterized protein MAL13P1.304-like [Melanaphis sacchari]